MCPRKQRLANAGVGKEFLTSLTEREFMMAAYEVAVETKSAKRYEWRIMDHALEPMMAALCQSHLDQRRSVDSVRSLPRSSADAGEAVGDHGKGKKGMGKQSKEKGKGKKKNKNKSKSGDGGNGKDLDSDWNTGQQAAQFQGCCSHCEKWGHKHADCQQRLAQQNEAGAVAGVEEPEEEGDKSLPWRDAEFDEIEADSLSWCLCGGDNSERAGRRGWSHLPS